MKSYPQIMTLLLFGFLLFACKEKAPQDQQSQDGIVGSLATTRQMIQFHSEHRCATCNLIEKLTREVLEEYSAIPFLLINVDDTKNEAVANEFEAFGTALFIYDPEGRRKKELTDFAFMHVNADPETFKEGIRNALNTF